VLHVVAAEREMEHISKVLSGPPSEEE